MVGVVVVVVVAVGVGVAVGVVVAVAVAMNMKNDSKPLAADFLSGGIQTLTEPSEGLRNAPGAAWDHSTTPSGIEIRFQNEPKRKYEIRTNETKRPIEGWDSEDWTEVPSVTQVLDVLDKSGALTWWGQRIGIEGVIELFERNELFTRAYAKDYGTRHVVMKYDSNDVVATADDIIELLKKEKLTCNHVRNKAGDRGNALHQAFQYWAETGTLPDAEFYPESEQGYVSGLVRFLDEAKPEPVRSEIMVGSIQHGYAGRYDLLAYYGGTEIVTHTTPKGKNTKVETLEPGLFLFDLKTSKNVYNTHHLQLAAYKHANTECGYESSDQEAIVRVTDFGTYEVVTGRATIDDFLAVKNCYEVLQKL